MCGGLVDPQLTLEADAVHVREEDDAVWGRGGAGRHHFYCLVAGGWDEFCLMGFGVAAALDCW